jgi:hypothetical protein
LSILPKKGKVDSALIAVQKLMGKLSDVSGALPIPDSELLSRRLE